MNSSQQTTSRTQARALAQQQQLLAQQQLQLQMQQQQAQLQYQRNGGGGNGGGGPMPMMQPVKKYDYPHIPILSLASFPPPSLQKYLSRYGLLEPTGALSYHHAVFPVPPLPSILTPPLLRRMSIATQSQAKKSKPRHLLNEVIDPIGGMGSERHVRAGTLDAPNGNASAAAAGAAGTSASGSGSGRNTPMMRLNEHGVEEDAMTGSATPYDITAALESTSTSLLSSSSTSSRRRKRTWHEPKTNEFANLTAYDSPAVVVERLAKKAKLHWDMRDSVKEGETLTNFIFALRMRDKTLRATPPG